MHFKRAPFEAVPAVDMIAAIAAMSSADMRMSANLLPVAFEVTIFL